MKQIIITINEDKLLAPLEAKRIIEILDDAIYEACNYANMFELLETEYNANEDLSYDEMETIVESVESAVNVEIK